MREKYLHAVRSHLDKVLAHGRDVYGPKYTPMWMASLDTRTGRYPADDTRPAHIGKRVYRNIDAPRGSTLYWDQPALVAAHHMSAVTGVACYAIAADAYVRAFLAHCVAPNGIFLWGNHYYYDAFRDTVMRFHAEEDPLPVNMAAEQGELHEIRPLVPVWELFWRVNPHATARAIRVSVAGHLVDEESGEFNRHAEGERGCAFLEAGGTLVESLAWLYARLGERDLLDTADKIAAYSFRHRDSATGLLENNPTWQRWDKVTATTEVGLWAGCLLRAAASCPGYRERGAWQEMADDAVRAWLRYGYDEECGRFYGRLRCSDGQPILGPQETPYQPGDYSDLWEPLFPTHDYPMALAESCLKLCRQRDEPFYRRACERWLDFIVDEVADLPEAYAEHYGRVIHYLLGYAETFHEGAVRELAFQVADGALDVLFAHGMFRGHPGEDRYDAVDGVGFLLLALLWLATGEDAPWMRW